jgi:hypothetical protein
MKFKPWPGLSRWKQANFSKWIEKPPMVAGGGVVRFKTMAWNTNIDQLANLEVLL